MGYFQTPWHIVLLLVIALLLFGGKRLPEIGRAMGSGMREFKDAVTGHSEAEQQEPRPLEQPKPPSAESTTATASPTTESGGPSTSPEKRAVGEAPSARASPVTDEPGG